jgi:hypothetical protein
MPIDILGANRLDGKPSVNISSEIEFQKHRPRVELEVPTNRYILSIRINLEVGVSALQHKNF